MEDTISSHVRRCLGLFSLPCFSELAQAVPPEKLVLLRINDQQTRFKVWSGSIGAHRDGTSSLDYRLRDASGIRLQVVRLLQDLSELLRDGCEILSGNKIPWDQLDDEECSDLEEEAPGTDDMPETELEQITGDVEEVVDCLVRLSMTIRNPAPYDRFKSFRANDTTYFEKFDIEHVQSKFSSLDRSLAERLGKSNSGRRQYFKYREDHYKKLSHDIEQALSQDPEVEAPHTVASSIPSHLKDECRTGPRTGPHAPAVFEDDASDAGVSQTSYATSLGDDPKTPRVPKLRVPSLPVEAHKGPFKCPFCQMWIVASTEMAWKKHVYSDLRPYICLEEDCTHPTHEYSRRHQWMDHMKENHWKVYRCMHGCDLAFSSITKCKDHIMHCHENTAPGPELDALIKLTAEPMDIGAGISCPLCQETLTSTSQYQRHVGRHQEQISLFALPNIEPDEDSGSDEDESEDESVHGASVSASANSTDNEALRTFPDDTKGPEDSTPALDSLKWDAKDIGREYCLCQTYAATDDMVACQSENCLNKLFHMSCVGLLIEPKGVWFCPVCIDNMDQHRSRTTGISRPSSRDKESRLQEDQDREDMEPGERLPEELFYRPEHIEWEQGMYRLPREDDSESNLDQDHKGSFFPAAGFDAVAVNARDRETATPLTAPINIEVGGAKINWHSGAQTNRSQTQSLAHESKDRPSRYNIPEERHASSEDQEPGMLPAPNQISKSDTHPTLVDTSLGFTPCPSKPPPELQRQEACRSCRKQKIRCSGYSPKGKCTNCMMMGKECVFGLVLPSASAIPNPPSALPKDIAFESSRHGAFGQPLPASYHDDDPPEHYYQYRDFKPVASSASTLKPTSSDASTRVPVPQKNTLSANQSRHAAPRWPVSPRLRSPPPILNKPQGAPPARKADQEPPTINVQRATPSSQPIMSLSQTDTDSDEVLLQSGARTPARSNSTLETVQEAKISSEPDKPLPWLDKVRRFFQMPLSGHQDGQPPLQYPQDPGETSYPYPSDGWSAVHPEPQDPGETSYPYPSDGWSAVHPELLKSINESQVSQIEPANVEADEQGVHTTTVAASVGSGPSRWVDDNFRPDNISWPLTDNMISGGDAELLSGTSAAYCCSVPDCLKLFGTPSELK